MSEPPNKGNAPRDNTRGARPSKAAYEQFLKRILAAKIAKARQKRKGKKGDGMTIEQVAHLYNARRYGYSYRATCPVHCDLNRSLCINEDKDGRVLIHCRCGCSIEEILKARGLNRKSLRQNQDA
jgi:hypothetical protein